MRQSEVFALIFLAWLYLLPSLGAQEISEFNRVLVTLDDGSRIDGDHGRLTTDSLTLLFNGERSSFARNEIKRLDRYKGNKAAIGFIAGAAIGLGGAALWYLSSERGPSPSVMEHSEMATYIFLAGAGGGVIGMLIGESYERWETVPLWSDFDISSDGRLGVRLTLRF